MLSSLRCTMIHCMPTAPTAQRLLTPNSAETVIPNFAIPVEAVKKAFQVTNTPELKKSAWRVTLPSEDCGVLSIQIKDTSVKVRAGDAIDLTGWILKHVGYFGENDDYLAFDPKALTNGLKKVSKTLYPRCTVYECPDHRG